MLKIALLAPMPSARVSMITTANPGLLRNPRNAWRMSAFRWFMFQSLNESSFW